MEVKEGRCGLSNVHLDQSDVDDYLTLADTDWTRQDDWLWQKSVWWNLHRSAVRRLRREICGIFETVFVLARSTVRLLLGCATVPQLRQLGVNLHMFLVVNPGLVRSLSTDADGLGVAGTMALNEGREDAKHFHKRRLLRHVVKSLGSLECHVVSHQRDVKKHMCVSIMIMFCVWNLVVSVFYLIAWLSAKACIGGHYNFRCHSQRFHGCKGKGRRWRPYR